MNNVLNENGLLHLQDVELMILKDFVKICDEHDIEYYLIYGTQIGAIRHNGFIPWDDDIDIIMFRKDYEKFLKVMESNPSEKYTVFDSRYNNEYFFQYGRFSLNGTCWAEYWDKQVSFELGIHIDLFILDNLPINKLKRWFYIHHCFIMARLYSLSLLKFDSFSPIINLILNCIHEVLNLLHLTANYFQKKNEKLFRKYENTNSEYVTDLTLTERVSFKVSDFKPPKKVQFEDCEFNIPNNDDNTLFPIYGDYMKLPPENERFCHILNDIDFGEY